MTTIPAIPGADDIIKAAKRIGPHIHQTPLLQSAIINELFDANIYFKCENFQKAGAFKSRGACNAVFGLTDSELKKGVCTHSSGNHAQALARAASLRSTPAFIVMPENSRQVKVNGVKHYKGEITFCKPNLESREQTLAKVQQETGAIEIHPYNDLRIICGQATCAYEVFNELDDVDYVIAPVGGGGLLSGTAIATHYFSKQTKVIAAEPENANDAFRSFQSKHFIPSIDPDTIADGLLTSLGSITFPIICAFVDQVLTTDESFIIKAMKLIWERMKIIVEPSSAVPLAALLQEKLEIKNKKIVIIVSGGNVDLNNLPWNV